MRGVGQIVQLFWFTQMSQRTSRKNQEDHKSNSFCLWKATDKLSLSNPERKNELLLTLSPGH